MAKPQQRLLSCIDIYKGGAALDSLQIVALELGLRGAAAGLFLMTVLVLLRARPADANKLLGAAMAAGGAAYAIATAPLLPKATQIWTMPVLAANPVVFWLWARTAFDDEFELRRWHGALWLAIVGLALSMFMTWTTWPVFARTAARALSVAALVLSFAAAVQTVRTWRADLVAGRRRLRVAMLGLSLLLIVVITASNLMLISTTTPGSAGSLFSSISLLALAALAATSLFAPPPACATMATADGTSGHAARVIRTDPGVDAVGDPAAPLLLRRLDHLMTVERIYRQEGVTIGMLAARLNLPDHRLRQLINECLGYRNFNVFLNRYRLDEAKAALADPGQREVPVLTIALDAGFQSIGPFNRAFKADTGLTPTEFRRDALAKAPSTRSDIHDNSKFGQPDQEFG